MRDVKNYIKRATDSKILCKVKNNSGVSLPELVASIPLAALVFIILALAIVNFITTYEETKLYIQLQDELFQAIETIRHGVVKENVTDGEGIIGVLTAGRVSIQNAGHFIKILPVIVTQGLGEESYKANFWLDDKNQLVANGRYGIKTFNNHVVFPSGNRKIGNVNMFQITKLKFTPQKGNSNEVGLLGIEIEAQVRFRKKLTKQTAEEDKEKNTKRIKYKTSIIVGNAGNF